MDRVQLWGYLRENGIVNDNPSNKALIAYGKKHNIASEGDGISMREGEYGEFESLDKDRLYQTLDDIERRFDIDITWDPFGDRGNESDTSGDHGSGTEKERGGSESAGSVDEPTANQATKSEDSTGSSAQRAATAESEEQVSSGGGAEHSQLSSESTSSTAHSGADHDDPQYTSDSDSPSTTETESTLATSETADTTDDSAGSNNPTSQGETESNDKSTSQDSETTYTGDESPVVKSPSDEDSPTDAADGEDVDPVKQRHHANRQSEDELDVATEVKGGVNLNEVEEHNNSDDSHDKFRTYEEPEVDDEEYDPDREAIKQFVAGFCTLHPDKKQEVKVRKDRVFNAMVSWSKINNVELDLLGEDTYIDRRKGEFKNILTKEYDVEHDQFSIDGEHTRGFRGMRLSESGEELLDVDVE